MSKLPPFSCALVTGASVGIGLAVAQLLADKGIALILNARDLDKLQQVAKGLESKVPVEIVAADLSNPTERQKVIAVIRRRQPDLVINNAGFGAYGEAIAVSIEKQLQMVELNDKAVLELTLVAAQELVSQGRKGTILNVSSVAGFLPCALFAVYGATKAFVTELSNSLDFELSSKGVRVLASCPGAVRTEFAERAGSKTQERTHSSMSPAYAAEQIWQQIATGQTIRLFSPVYRFMVALGRLLPRNLVAGLLKKEIEKRLR